MSLYNLVHGENRGAEYLLAMLGLTRSGVPRYRDCFWNGKEICIYTRTGGGNRDYYESEESCRENYPKDFEDSDAPNGPWNADLRIIPGFLRDEDDEFDATYATFYYTPRSEFRELLEELPAADATPAQRWETVLDKLRSGSVDDPQVKRIMDALAPLFARIKEITK